MVVFSHAGVHVCIALSCVQQLSVYAASEIHAVTKQVEERYDILFPKYKTGGYIVRKLSIQHTVSLVQVYNYKEICFSSKLYRWPCSKDQTTLQGGRCSNSDT